MSRLRLILLLITLGLFPDYARSDAPNRAEVHVGIAEGEFRGSDGRTLQAAIDHVGGLGGGTVHVGPGRYLFRNSLFLRNCVRVVGTPGKTILTPCPSVKVRLAADGDCNERQITLTDAAGFQIGDGVAVTDDNGHGFHLTTATLTARVDATTFSISKPLYSDYMMHAHVSARLVFPVIAGHEIKGAVVEGLTIDGNKAKTDYVDGCRAGGIFLFECADVTIRNCHVRDYNGDGISFQVSNDIKVLDCVCEGNTGLGLHPGSGSQRPICRGNRCRNNSQDGLFVCWRVKHGVFEDNELRDNGRAGVSIGHKDSDNMFRRNTITGNGQTGVLFRNESEPMGAHRNIFEANRIVDNGQRSAGKPPPANVVIVGHHHDLVFRGNTIGYTKPVEGGTGVRAGQEVLRLRDEANEWLHVKPAVERVP